MPTERGSCNGDQPTMERLVLAARNGSRDSLGLALDACRRYLLLVANRAIGMDLLPKVAPSDVVQETLIAAAEHFGDFTGKTEEELLRWLTQMLSYRIQASVRKFRETQQTAIDKEVRIDSLGQDVERSLFDGDTPSAFILAREEEERLAAALATLDETERRVVHLRNWDLQTFEAIAGTLGRSESGARKIWAQAIRKLKRSLDANSRSEGAPCDKTRLNEGNTGIGYLP